MRQQDARRGEYHSSLQRVSNAIVLHKDMCNSDLLAGILDRGGCNSCLVVPRGGPVPCVCSWRGRLKGKKRNDKSLESKTWKQQLKQLVLFG